MTSEIKTINGKFNHNGQKMQMQPLEIKDIKPINIQKQDLITNFKKKKTEEDSNTINSAEYSENNLASLKPEMVNYNNGLRTAKINEDFIHKKYQMTLRMEAQKYFTERENQQKKFETKNPYIHLFDNNPQFSQMLKKTEKQLYFFILHILFLILYEGIITFRGGKNYFGLTMTSFIISVTCLSFFLMVFLALKSGFLKDPNLSQSFRFIVILGFITYILSYIFYIVSFFYNIQKLKDDSSLIFRLFSYFIFLKTVILIYPTLLKGYYLFIESVLIFFKKKTEYSILILNEQNNITGSQNNTNSNLVTSNNLNLPIKDNKNILQYEKDQQDFRNYIYFSKFHASVSYRDKGTF